MQLELLNTTILSATNLRKKENSYTMIVTQKVNKMVM